MISKSPGRKFNNNHFMVELELTDTIVSFKELFGYLGKEDIYSGKENLPFREKHVEFQKIMLNEFMN
jgi:hypothetical protein